MSELEELGDVVTDQYRTMILTAGLAGLRQGELLAYVEGNGLRHGTPDGDSGGRGLRHKKLSGHIREIERALR